MENLTPTEKLDVVLFFLKTQHQYLTWNSIRFELGKNGSEYEVGDFIRIMDKLINDGYLIEEKSNDKGTSIESICIISYSGYLFHGYLEQEKHDELVQRVAEANESRARRNETRLVNGTWFAGAAAVFLLLWQIFLYFYPKHSDFPYWIWETIPKK
jgi:hypothetical protein